jgi:uncharacterized protein YutE (UPF0331/DUF86 family)
MNEKTRWEFINGLDEDLLKGGVILSEWCAFIVREADLAFAKGADLASILTAMAGIETYLRSEYAQSQKDRFYELIDMAQLDAELTETLHQLRKYRNKWVHVSEPWDDAKILENPQLYEQELEEMAILAARTLRQVLYENQWV